MNWSSDRQRAWVQMPKSFILALVACLSGSPVTDVRAEPSLLGQSGLIRMPDARIEADGGLRMGYVWDEPYRAGWASLTMLPRLELSGRYTRISHVPSGLGSDYGDYKDKAFDAKWVAFKETDWLPQVALGARDFLGTRLWGSEYIAFSKRFGDADFTLGYGSSHLNGVFAGVRWKPEWLGGLAFVAEHDSTDYRQEPFAVQSGIAGRQGGWSYALEYRSDLWGVQIGSHDDNWHANLFVSLPLMAPEFIPKIDEPKPYRHRGPRASLQEWQDNRAHPLQLAEALRQQGFRNIRMSLEGTTLRVGLAQGRILRVGRAVGRAVRTITLGGPTGLERIEITYVAAEMPLLSYQFRDVYGLELYFAGKLPLRTLRNSMAVFPSDPAYYDEIGREDLLAFDETPEESLNSAREESRMMAIRTEDAVGSGFNWNPVLFDTYLNDPSGAFRYDIYTKLRGSRRLAEGLYLGGSVTASLYENISGVKQKSNSLLPHVRSDLAEYKSGSRVRMESLLLNQYLKPGRELYARVSGGYYEDMFAGVGGQVLYWPEGQNWAVDVAIDALRQRSSETPFGFREYDTITAIGSLHYRLPELGVTATARVGRFLAKDNGVRFELSRRFRSGIEFGVWYTVTDGNDITTPGSPASPYHDKGFFFSIPIAGLLTRDTRTTAGFSLSPWTRDVGQMVASPGDLYRLVEFNRPNSDELNPYSGFGQ